MAIDVNRSRAVPGIQDLDMLQAALQAAAHAPGAEQPGSAEHAHLEELIAKPWGREYRVYADLFFDVWKLYVRGGHSTSLHCHPRKDTALVCLSGSGTTHFLDRERALEPFDVVHISRGTFHCTENTGLAPLHLVEVELPRNKLDLVRLGDQYGRAGQGYETTSGPGALEPLVPAPVPHALVRGHSLNSGYRFGVLSGDAIARTADPGALFAVPLSLDHALAGRIEVVPLSIDAAPLDPTVDHLAISRRL